MSVNGPIKIWRMQPGLEHYRTGMELGEPHEIVFPNLIITKPKQINENSPHEDRIKRGLEMRKRRNRP